MKKKMTHFDGSSLGSLQSDSGSVSPMAVPEAQTHSEMPGSLFPAPPGPAALPMSGLQHGGSLQQVVASQWAWGAAPSPRSATGALQPPAGSPAGHKLQGHWTKSQLAGVQRSTAPQGHGPAGAPRQEDAWATGQGALRPGSAWGGTGRESPGAATASLQTHKKSTKTCPRQWIPHCLRRLCLAPREREYCCSFDLHTGSMPWSHSWTWHTLLEKCKPGWCVLTHLMESLEPGACTHYMFRAKVKDELFGYLGGLTDMISNAPYTGINRHSSTLLEMFSKHSGIVNLCLSLFLD